MFASTCADHPTKSVEGQMAYTEPSVPLKVVGGVGHCVMACAATDCHERNKATKPRNECSEPIADLLTSRIKRIRLLTQPAYNEDPRAIYISTSGAISRSETKIYPLRIGYSGYIKHPPRITFIRQGLRAQRPEHAAR